MPPVSVTFNFAGPVEAAAFLQTFGTGTQADVAEAPAPVVAKPAAAPRTRKAAEPAAAPVAAPAAAPKPAPAPAPAPVAAPADDMKKQAIATLVKLINANDALGRNGKQVCTDLCLKFGGANISKIDPSKYPAVIEAVEEALANLETDPTE